MHVVVVGCGRVGSELAGALELAGHTVSVVDKNQRAFRRLPADFKGNTVVGFGFDRDHLAEAGIDEAGAFASVTNGDNSNILCARIAREAYRIERVVARIYDPRRALIYQRLGIPTVATVTWTTDQVLRRLLPGETHHDWIDPSGNVCLVERAIPAAAVGRKMALLNQSGRFWLTAVSRLGQAACGHGRHDRAGRRRAHLRQRHGRDGGTPVAHRTCRGALMRVAIAGAGNVGLFIANDLAGTGHEVLLIEQNENVARRLTTDPEVEVVVADACEVTSLRAAGLEKCEVVVAATGDDEDNLVISLLAKQEFGVPRVIARVNHPKNEWMFNENWGVDLSVSTPQLITALVEEAVSVGRLVRILQFERGTVRLVEVTLAPDAPVIDQAIKDLDIHRDATVVAVLRGDHVVMPRGDTIFEAGDEVLAMVTADSEDDVRKILTGG